MNVSRRDFLKTAGGAVATLALWFGVPTRAIGISESTRELYCDVPCDQYNGRYTYVRVFYTLSAGEPMFSRCEWRGRFVNNAERIIHMPL